MKLPKPGDYLLTVSDLVAIWRHVRARSTPADWLKLLAVGGVAAGVARLSGELEAGVFAGLLTAVLAWRVSGTAPLVAALVLLVLIPVLQLLYSSGAAPAGDIWAERVAVWAYYMLVIGVVTRAVELARETRRQRAPSETAPATSGAASTPSAANTPPAAAPAAASRTPAAEAGELDDPTAPPAAKPAAEPAPAKRRRPAMPKLPNLPKIPDLSKVNVTLPKMPAIPRVVMGPVAPGHLPAAAKHEAKLEDKSLGHQRQPEIPSLRRQRILDRRGLEPPESILLQGTISRPVGRRRTPINPETGHRARAVDNVIPRRRSRPD